MVNCYALAIHQEKHLEKPFYLKYIKENQVSTKFIFSKSKIATNKELLIPRLELFTASIELEA